MRAADIAHTLGEARREGRNWRCRCPLHYGRNLVLRDGDSGRVLATCWGGCDRLDVLAELRRRRFLDQIDRRPLGAEVLPPQFNSDYEDDAGRITRARAILDATLPALPSPMVDYLASRGITLAPPATLRWAPRCWHPEVRQELPAMVGVVEHVERGIVGIHRTFLRADGSGKAHLGKDWQRRALGPIGGGAVRLGIPLPGEWLAVAEGIETTLAVMTACAIPGWAALSAGGIRALILPPEATHVIICADHDASGIGQRAAHEAASRWLAEGRRVRLAMPPAPDTDFNDLLRTDATAITEVRHVA